MADQARGKSPTLLRPSHFLILNLLTRVMVRDIARNLTLDHVPFAYKWSSGPFEP